MTDNLKRIWCSGIIVPSHGTDQGSIPWMRIASLLLLFFTHFEASLLAQGSANKYLN